MFAVHSDLKKYYMGLEWHNGYYIKSDCHLWPLSYIFFLDIHTFFLYLLTAEYILYINGECWQKFGVNLALI